jgi:diguanylate cyclase (GGDEF)-like protein
LQYAGFRTLTVSDPVIVTEKLTDFMPDMILMDLNMPECNGIELAAVIRQDVAFLATPIVFLSAEIDRERQFSVMKNGGDDFLVKPVKPSHLATLVQLRCGRGRMLRSHMVRDGLTGLLNHNRINERLTSEVARAIRQKSHLTIAMIDVDHLRSINSAHGHPVGDRVLKSLARLLQQRLRTTDLIGRFGGEEFIAIMIGAQADKAIEIMDEIRNSFEMVDQCSKSVEFTASISCGIATLNENSTAILMIEAAKDALGKAKKLGRNRVTVAN